FSGEATVPISSRAAAAVLLMTAAAHAAGQGNLPQRMQDSGAVQNPNIQSPGPNDAEPTVTVFDRLEVQRILGKEVRDGAKDNIGRIVDVIVDRTGQVR